MKIGRDHFEGGWEWHAMYRSRNHVIVLDVYNREDNYVAYIHFNGVEVATAEWLQCEHVRRVYFTNINRRWAWLVDMIENEYRLNIPMEV